MLLLNDYFFQVRSTGSHVHFASSTSTTTGGAEEDEGVADENGKGGNEDVSTVDVVASLIFDEVDRDGVGHVGLEGFSELCAFIDVSIIPRRQIAPCRAATAGVLRGRISILLFDIVVIMSLAQVYLDAYFDSNAVTVDGRDELALLVDLLGIVFQVIFCLELILKCWAFGWQEFWSDSINRLDLVLSLLAVAYYTTTMGVLVIQVVRA